MTVEALCLQPWYSELFDAQDADLARRRPGVYRFDVEGFFRRQMASPPSWVARAKPQGPATHQPEERQEPS